MVPPLKDAHVSQGLEGVGGVGVSRWWLRSLPTLDSPLLAIFKGGVVGGAYITGCSHQVSEWEKLKTLPSCYPVRLRVARAQCPQARPTCLWPPKWGFTGLTDPQLKLKRLF